MSDVPRVTLTDQRPEVVQVPKPIRQFVDAPEPGTYRDEFTGRLVRYRRKSEWWGNLLDRIRQ